MRLFLLREIAGRWEAGQHEARYRALLRDEWDAIAWAAGFIAIRWLMPHESGYHQPVMIARKGDKD